MRTGRHGRRPQPGPVHEFQTYCLLRGGGDGQAGPTAVVEAKRWARCSNASSESGLRTAPSDTTAPRDAPCSNRLTGTSSFLPVRLYGMAGTATTSSGTWRGERRAPRHGGVLAPKRAVRYPARQLAASKKWAEPPDN